jgi:hypothetical protein
LRVISIFLASEISWSRVSSGISPICVRYIRTGSSIFSVVIGSSSALGFLSRRLSLSTASPRARRASFSRTAPTLPSTTATPLRSSTMRMRSIISGEGASSGAAVLSSS